MTPTPLSPRVVNSYAAMADKRERDPIVEYMGRATVPMGRGFAWSRFNPGVQLVYIDDAEGHPRGITPKQAAVLALAIECIDGPLLTMRGMAERLGYAPSTVSRALTKFSAWGILAVIVGRGRWTGAVIIRRVKGDGLDRFRKAAKSRVWGWKQAAERRLSLVKFNVATMYPWKEITDHGYEDVYVDGMVATLNAKPWTDADMAELDAEMACAT